MSKEKLTFLIAILLLTSVSLVYADSDNDLGHEAVFERAEEIIDDQTPCNLLTEEDLEALGEYFMEQMHPGEAHISMDQRMGGEGSESLRIAHVGMGSRFYCGTNPETYSNYGMMGGGMMMGSGMMGSQRSWNNYSGGSLSYWFFWWIIAILLVIIMVLIILLLIKKLNENGKRKK